eukprot:TRINITY_DN5481_c0_g4_i1.p1 TRINITY_DN5481_c0_g4~~TRINITY_DN5481_c0_g4_i1.p1  ORF type:complete len:542 (-),score=72.32 TRINITY_DN5481_c0_g4_i1:263-1888(-)
MLGVVLVVNGSFGGNQLVFRYPPVTRNRVSHETMQEYNTRASMQPNYDPNRPSSSGNTSTNFPQKRPESKKNKYTFAPYENPGVTLSVLLIPKRSQCNKVLDLTLSNVFFVGFPALLIEPEGEEKGETPPGDIKDSQHGEDGEKDKEKEITAFNIVFCLSEEYASKVKIYGHLSKILAGALKHEQKRCRYLTEEVKKMMRVREAWLSAQSGKNPPDREQLTANLLQVSSLAEQLKQIFHDLKETGIAHAQLNHWVPVSLNIEDPANYPLFPFRPYQTVLLNAVEDSPLGPKTKLGSDLPPDSSSALRKLFDVACPKKTFAEIQTEIGIPLYQLYRLAAHLVYWNKAKVISVLHAHNVYVTNPKGEITSALCQEFNQAFYAWKLPEVLHLFNSPRELSDVNTWSKNEGTEIVVWLLRRNLLVNLHNFYYLTIPREGNSSKHTFNITSYSSLAKERMSGGGSTLSEHETTHVKKLDDSSNTYKLLLRLLPYFRGKHHMEEIMWRENVSREDLKKVTEKYKSIVISCLRQDEHDFLLFSRSATN